MKLTTLVTILPLYAAHHIKDFAGKQATQLASPEEFINLGQAQIQTHNEVLRKGEPVGYYNPYLTPYYNPYLFRRPIATYYNPFRYILPKRIAYIPTSRFISPYYAQASRVASPATQITVGSLFNNNQGAVKKE